MRKALERRVLATRRRIRRAVKRISTRVARALPDATLGHPRVGARRCPRRVHSGRPIERLGHSWSSSRRRSSPRACGAWCRAWGSRACSTLGARSTRELPRVRRCCIVGDGPLAGELAERAAHAPLAGRVRVLGRVSDEDLIDVYRAADVAVVPTLAVEGFGLVVLEAAACGTPSIVSDVGGLPEAAAPLDASLVVASADTAALGARLRAAAGGRLPSRAATRGYAERYSWPKLAERHRTLYRRLATGERDERLRVVYLDHVARLSGGEIAILRLLPHLRHVHAHVILGEEGILAERLQQAGISVEVLPVRRRRPRCPPRLGATRRRLADGRAAHAQLYAAAGAPPAPAAPRSRAHELAEVRRLRRPCGAELAGVPLVWHLRDRIAEDYIPRPAVRVMRSFIARAGRRRDRQLDRHARHAARARPRARLGDPRLGRSLQRESRATIGEARRRSGCSGGSRHGRGRTCSCAPSPPPFPTGAGAGGAGRQADVRRGGLRAASCTSSSRSSGLGGRVEFRGFREDVWRELASFDVLVHASVIPEPFGQVVLEGMAAGLAVIAPDEGGPADRDRRRRDRASVSKPRLDSLAAAMSALHADPAERERLGRAAQHAAEDYNPRILAGRFESAYDRVLAERGHAASRRGPIQPFRGGRR